MSLWRLLADEEIDVVRQAQAVSQVVGMTVRAAREQAVVRRVGERDEVWDVMALLRLIGTTERADEG